MQSTCVKCSGTRFEMKLNEPSGAAFQYYFIQCTKCGGVVGVTDFFHTHSTLQKIMKKLGIH